MKDAGSDMAEYVQQHQDLESSLPSDVLVKWGLQVEAWEADPSLLNPFEQVIISKSHGSILNWEMRSNSIQAPTQAAVRRELSEQEGRLLAAGQDFSVDAEVSPSSFVAIGIGIEAEQ